MADRHKERHADTDVDQSLRQADETQREYLIRTGKITPFSRISGIERDAGEEELEATFEEQRSHQFLRAPGFDSGTTTTATTSGTSSDLDGTDEDPSPRKRKRLVRPKRVKAEDEDYEYAQAHEEELEDDEDNLLLPHDEDEDDEDAPTSRKKKDDLSNIDDGNEQHYLQRIKKWVEKRAAARRRA